MLNKLIIFIVTEDSNKSSSSMILKLQILQVPHNVALALEARNFTSGFQHTLESHLRSFREGCKDTEQKPSINGKVLEDSFDKLLQVVPSSTKHYKSQIWVMSISTQKDLI